MSLCYDVVRIILKIKYQNWLNELKCLCGADDYRECSIVECYECNDMYCLLQTNFTCWMMECRFCEKFRCGKHDLYVDNKFCQNCYNLICEADLDNFTQFKNRIKKLTEKKSRMYKKYCEKEMVMWIEKNPEEYAVVLEMDE